MRSKAMEYVGPRGRIVLALIFAVTGVGVAVLSTTSRPADAALFAAAGAATFVGFLACSLARRIIIDQDRLIAALRSAKEARVSSTPVSDRNPITARYASLLDGPVQRPNDRSTALLEMIVRDTFSQTDSPTVRDFAEHIRRPEVQPPAVTDR